MNYFVTSILIFPRKVKSPGRISRPKLRKRSIFVFIEKRSFKTLRVHAGIAGCKTNTRGVRWQSRFTKILNTFYILANLFAFTILILCTWTVILYGTDCIRAVAQYSLCGL